MAGQAFHTHPNIRVYTRRKQKAKKSERSARKEKKHKVERIPVASSDEVASMESPKEVKPKISSKDPEKEVKIETYTDDVSDDDFEPVKTGRSATSKNDDTKKKGKPKGAGPPRKPLLTVKGPNSSVVPKKKIV